MKEHIGDTFLRRLGRSGNKEVWSVDYIGGETGRVRRASQTFPSRSDAELHAKAKLGSVLD